MKDLHYEAMSMTRAMWPQDSVYTERLKRRKLKAQWMRKMSKMKECGQVKRLVRVAGNFIYKHRRTIQNIALAILVILAFLFFAWATVTPSSQWGAPWIS